MCCAPLLCTQGKKSAKAEKSGGGLGIVHYAAAIVLVGVLWTQFNGTVEVASAGTAAASTPAKPLNNQKAKKSQNSKTLAAVTTPVTVNLLENGEHEGGEESSLNDESLKGLGFNLYRLNGELVRSVGQLEAGESLVKGPTEEGYSSPPPHRQHLPPRFHLLTPPAFPARLPRSHQFYWPSHEVGHRVALPWMEMPRGVPIELETLAASPRAFFVHNFMTDAETDMLIATAVDPKNPYSIRPSTTGHKSWTEGGGDSTSSVRTSMNGFDLSSPAARAIKARAFEILRVHEYQVRDSSERRPQQAADPGANTMRSDASPGLRFLARWLHETSLFDLRVRVACSVRTRTAPLPSRPSFRSRWRTASRSCATSRSRYGVLRRCLAKVPCEGALRRCLAKVSCAMGRSRY